MCKTIKQIVKFKAPPNQVYGQLAPARGKEGGRFTARAGRVSGINVQLKPGLRIVQAWRDRAFPEGIFSMATINLSRTARGGTQLVLTHRGVPKDLIPRIEREWRDECWNKIKRLA